MLTERIKESIRLRFMLVFIGTLLLAGLFTFPTILISESQRVMTSIEDQLNLDAGKIETLSQYTELSPEEIAALAQSSAVVIQVLDVDEQPEDGDGNPLELEDGERRLLGWQWDSLPRLAMRYDGQYYLLIPNMTNNQYETLKDVAFRVLWACTLIGSLLMLIAVRTITEPVRRLNAATKRVAQGDFDVKIPEAARDELGQLTRNFNRMTRQLKQMETLRSDFISSISHEFKTPLASIQGFARLLQNKNLPVERVQEYTQVILEETTRLTTLSSNILRLNALENQTIPHKATEFSLDEQIRRSVLLLVSQWEPKEIEFDMDLDPLRYYGDQDLLQQVWMNLVGNAIKFSHQGGRIYLALKRERQGVSFTCRDEGVGISPADQKRIFEKFYQADRSRAKEGNGLGLAIVQRILKLCGGSVSFESELGQGTTFTVKLPGPLQKPQEKGEKTSPKRHGGQQGDSKRTEKNEPQRAPGTKDMSGDQDEKSEAEKET